MTYANNTANLLTRLLSQVGVLFLAILVGVVMAAPYFISVIANIGRRPVTYRRAAAPRRTLAGARRSAA